MQAVRRRTRGIIGGMFPERPDPGAAAFSRFAVPHQFNPSLGIVEGVIAVAAVFARILTLCVIFAVWAVLSLLGWEWIASPLWRGVALLPMLLALPLALVPPMLAIAALERWCRPRRP